MGICAWIELPGEDIISTDDNGMGSKTIANLISLLFVLCDDWKREGSEEYFEWFQSVQEKTRGDICVLCKATRGEWPFELHEYDRYLKSMGIHDAEETDQKGRKDVLSEEGFEQIFEELEEKWTGIDALREVVAELAEVLARDFQEEQWWYHPMVTVQDLHNFAERLGQLPAMGFDKIRIILM